VIAGIRTTRTFRILPRSADAGDEMKFAAALLIGLILRVPRYAICISVLAEELL